MYEKIYFPYRVTYILGTIVDVLNLDEEMKQYYGSKKNSNNIADTFIPAFLKLFKVYMNRIDDQSKSSKVSLAKLNEHKEECSLIEANLANLNDK